MAPAVLALISSLLLLVMGRKPGHGQMRIIHYMQMPEKIGTCSRKVFLKTGYLAQPEPLTCISALQVHGLQPTGAQMSLLKLIQPTHAKAEVKSGLQAPYFTLIALKMKFENSKNKNNF